MKKAVLLAVLMTGACAHDPTPVQIRTETVYVKVRAACPAPEERARLKGLRPTPLRDQEKPSNPTEKAGRVSSQLGDYEADGGWADQMDDAMDRCQEETPIPQ